MAQWEPQPAATAQIEYYCQRGHTTRVRFNAEAIFDLPPTWHCATCHQVAHRQRPSSREIDYGGESDTKPPTQGAWEALTQRRSDAEGEEILDAALAQLRANSRPMPPAPPPPNHSTK